MCPDGSIQLVAFNLQLGADVGYHGVPEARLLLWRGDRNSWIVAALYGRYLGESPDKFEEQLWMFPNVERLGDDAAPTVPPEDPCEGTGHGDRVHDESVLASKDLRCEGDLQAEGALSSVRQVQQVPIFCIELADKRVRLAILLIGASRGSTKKS